MCMYLFLYTAFNALYADDVEMHKALVVGTLEAGVGGASAAEGTVVPSQRTRGPTHTPNLVSDDGSLTCKAKTRAEPGVKIRKRFDFALSPADNNTYRVC